MKIGKGNRSTAEKTCPSGALSTTNPTCIDPVLNPGRRGGKPATNRLSYGNKASQFSFSRSTLNSRVFSHVTIGIISTYTYAMRCISFLNAKNGRSLRREQPAVPSIR
jgi:hypothetical protein